MGKLTICMKEDIDVNLDFFNNQLGLDCEQLLVEFFLEGQNHANGYNFGYYTFLCCCDCVPESDVQIDSACPQLAILSNLFVMLKNLSSEYQLYACG